MVSRFDRKWNVVRINCMLENNEMIDNLEESASDNEPSQSPKNNKPKGSKGSKKNLEIGNVLLRFTSCGRCGMFLTSYRISNGDQALENAIANSYDSWLSLPWNQDLRKLIIKSFGCRLDGDVYFFENSCPECLGTFRYTASESDEPAVLLFKI